jgi:cystathionine gamma-synthase
MAAMDDRIATRAVWAGEEPSLAHGGTQVPIQPSIAFGYDDVDGWLAVALGQAAGHIYSRNTNPTVAALEAKLRDLEGAAAAVAFASGMAAISNTLFELLLPGTRVVSVKDTYGGTNQLFVDFLPRRGVAVELCDTTDHEAIEQAVARGCNVLYLESPTNPTLKVVDLRHLAAVGHEAGAIVVVDNTFATPVNQRPIELGADLVVHSASKFLGGHADALGGLVCGRADLVQRIYHFREITGAALGPIDAYLLLRGMKTLAPRVERQNENALAVARFLAAHPAVDRVHYPGLESDEGHEIARRQMTGFGGVLSFALTGGEPAVRAALPRLRLAHRAANLGAVETIAGIPATTSHVECSPQERAAMGIPEGLVRFSVGIEDARDLCADLDQALAAV